MFELLGISLFLAGLLTFNCVASLIAALTWRLTWRLTANRSARARADLLFLLRTLPTLLAVFFVMVLIAPAYLAYEPRNTGEGMGLKLGVLAFLSALAISIAVARSIATWRATVRLTVDWLAKAEPFLIPGIKTSTYRIHHAFPVIAIIGAFRPRLFVANQVLEMLSEDEIAAAVAHESGHIIARDNLKRSLMRACRNALLIFPSGNALDKAWADAAEEAADENAAREGDKVALDLASALVKIAKIIPLGARPTMPAGAFLFGDDETNALRRRVSRLVEFAASSSPPQFKRDLLARQMFWSAAGILLFIGLLVHSQTILLNVHELIEHAVYFLD